MKCNLFGCKKLKSLFLATAFVMCMVQINHLPTQAAATKKIVKMLDGKWDKCGEQGLMQERYAIFTKNYIKWYYDGQLDHKDKIVKVVKKSNKKYVFKMKGTDGYKFRYIGHVKNKKFYSLEYFSEWSGADTYSGSSSLMKLE